MTSKLETFSLGYIKCPNCDYVSKRYDRKDNKDYLGLECPDCRVKRKTKEVEKRNE